MIYVADIKQVENGEEFHLDLFLYDSDTGLTARSAIEVPGAYGSIVKNYKSSLCLAKLENITLFAEESEYNTSLYGLLWVMDDNSIEPEFIDITAELTKLLRMPETVKEKILSQYDNETAVALEKSLEVMRYFEGLDTNIKTVLPEEAFQFMPEDQKKSMMSTRKTYMLGYEDNIDVFQKDYSSEYVIQLPSLQEIHDGDYNMSEMDILRIIAPLRQVEAGGHQYSYRAIYHTPYYKVDPRIRGSIPKSISWLEGYCKNDELELQPNERKMFDNLYTLICSDIAYYVDKIITGIFNTTTLGTALRRFATAKTFEELSEIIEEIMSISSNIEEISCNISLEDIDDIQQGKRSAESIIKDKLNIEKSYYKNMLSSWNNTMNIVNCEKLVFTLELDEDTKAELTDILIEKGVLTNSMFDFIRKLCAYAYMVNWGHSGVTLAINCLINVDKIGEISELLATWVTAMMTNNQKLITPQVAAIINSENNTDYNESLDDDDSEDSFTAFDRYLSRSTVARIQSAELSVDALYASDILDPETAIVERIRKENGDNSLYLYLAEVFDSTKDPKALILCFIRLMRWGEVKPKTLMLPEYQEVKNVFELDSGSICLNTDILDDSMIIKKNGCTYSYVRPVYAQSNCISVQNPIIGFQLEVDYGSVKTTELISWSDLGEMVLNGVVDIAEFKTLTHTSMKIDDSIAIEDIVKEKFNLYVSDEMVKLALEKKMRATDLNNLSLLTIPNVVESQAYLRAIRNKDILTSTDIMYKNLREYLKALSEFYTVNENKIESVESTVQISELAKEFMLIYKNIKDGVTTPTTSGVKSMSLGDSSNKFIDCELTGKFMLVYDDTMTAPFTPIKFSEEIMQKVSAKLRNRVVLLLMDAGDKFVFCQKDAKVSEIIRDNNSLSTKVYSKLSPAIDAIAAGKNVKISSKSAYIHSDLKKFLF